MGECKEEFDIILTVEEKVYDQTLEYFSEREAENETPVHVINMNVVDNPEDATIGAFLLCELAQNLSISDDLDNDIDDIIQDFEAKCEREFFTQFSSTEKQCNFDLLNSTPALRVNQRLDF